MPHLRKTFKSTPNLIVSKEHTHTHTNTHTHTHTHSQYVSIGTNIISTNRKTVKTMNISHQMHMLVNNILYLLTLIINQSHNVIGIIVMYHSIAT